MPQRLNFPEIRSLGPFYVWTRFAYAARHSSRTEVQSRLVYLWGFGTTQYLPRQGRLGEHFSVVTTCALCALGPLPAC